MSAEVNKQVVRRVYEEVINQENHAVIDTIYAPDLVLHDPFMGEAHGVEAFKQLLGMFDAAFPHHRVSIEDITAEGDMVYVLHTHTAKHTGPFMGMPPTGKDIVVNGVEVFRMSNGKIAEFWRKDDDAGMLMQLGVLPPPQAA